MRRIFSIVEIAFCGVVVMLISSNHETGFLMNIYNVDFSILCRAIKQGTCTLHDYLLNTDNFHTSPSFQNMAVFIKEKPFYPVTKALIPQIILQRRVQVSVYFMSVKTMRISVNRG